MRIQSVALRTLTVIALFSISVTPALHARSRRKNPPKNKLPFSYYLLVLSYAPDFCAQPQGDKDARECGSGRHVGFIVHGLWPQGETTRGPENCGGSPVSQSIIAATLNYVPTESLIQHEWKAHGSCTGLPAADYFALLRKARDSVKIPNDLNQPDHQKQLSPADLASKLAAANSGFSAEDFRISCYPSKELQEIRICLNKDLSPRTCGSSAGQCQAGSVTMRPVR